MKRLFLLFLCLSGAVWAQNARYDYDSTGGYHRFGWAEGRVPEFNNAFILKKHRVRLNILGRTSWAATRRLEISTYLPLIFMPNLSFKRVLINKSRFAASAEYGFITGALPVTAGTGLLLPGLVAAGGTAGIIHGFDNYLRLYVSYKPNTRLTFSLRGGASLMRMGYTGLVGGIAAGGDAVFAAVLPVNAHTSWKRWYMGGAEIDYVINPINALVLNASLAGFENTKKMIFFPRLAWVHARNHFHYMIGLYSLLDPPQWDIVKRSNYFISPYANVYWIF